ncbi:copper amine oxidase N-terminal domain-containing protein [Paenibacillus sp. HWE-109]|uniref:stalk domain-containing protein n=1 Tax=Paenibacillus sp. HWE-109 TaxID=1306526 RepID=UPI001EE15091|nr:stalk domain-containing protein [Paenibacillus sp. HWE-109]UKS28656.1 copper amine oxidase N-terminal domain-containing protein [Paenibacillus sp. HWE-109]
MKKYIIGFIFGAVLSTSSVIYASDSIQSLLWPVQFEINGKSHELGDDYAVLNYKGHAYVPVRFVAEKLNQGINYRNKDNTISIMTEPSGDNEAEKKIWQIQYRIHVGDDKNHIISIFGEPSKITNNFKKEIWRYDISARNDYKYSESSQNNLDFSGLENGSIGAQLYITWTNDGQIDSIVSGFKQDRWVYNYYVLTDGSSGINLME